MKKKLIITESQYKKLVENINEAERGAYDMIELQKEVDYANRILEKRGMVVKRIEEGGVKVIYTFNNFTLTQDGCVKAQFNVAYVNNEIGENFNESRTWCIGESPYGTPSRQRWDDALKLIQQEDQF